MTRYYVDEAGNCPGACDGYQPPDRPNLTKRVQTVAAPVTQKDGTVAVVAAPAMADRLEAYAAFGKEVIAR